MWLIVFDHLLNAFNERKTISRGFWGWKIFFFMKFGKGEGVYLSLWRQKI